MFDLYRREKGIEFTRVVVVVVVDTSQLLPSNSPLALWSMELCSSKSGDRKSCEKKDPYSSFP